MDILGIAFTCVVALFIVVWAFFRAAHAFGRVSGFRKLVTHHAYSGPPPANTRSRTFCVGSVGNGTGSAGSSETGLYLHGGLLGESVLIPWEELQTIAHFGKFTLLRSRRAGVCLLLSSELCERSVVTPAQAN